MASVQSSWDPIYYKCFTLRFNNSQRTNVRGLSAILYVDQFLDNQLVEFDLSLGNSRATGVRELVHAPGTAPDMTLGVSLGPGTEASLMLSQTSVVRLGYPYSNCTDEQRVSAGGSVGGSGGGSVDGPGRGSGGRLKGGSGDVGGGSRGGPGGVSGGV